MQPEITRIRARLAAGETVETIIREVYERIEANEGAPPVLCRTDEEINAADALEWADLIDSAKARGAAPATIELLRGVRTRIDHELQQVYAGASAVVPVRLLFEDLGGLPPAVAAIISLTNSRYQYPHQGPADFICSFLQSLFSELPGRELDILREAAANRPVHAFITLYPREDVLAQAKALDLLRVQGNPLPPLAGVTLAVKDNFVLGKTTGASRILSDYTAPDYYTATAVERLTAMGAIVLGKANLDELALGSSNESTAYWPAPRNPRNTTRVTGGSSGGSTAAVAAGFAALALGSDTSGSIRLPAAYCGVVGVKPTYGLVSRYGMFALASSLDCAGPVANTVEDAAIALGYMAGPDGKDQTVRVPRYAEGSSSPELRYAGTLSNGTWAQRLHGTTVGVPLEFFIDLDPDDEMLRRELLEGECSISRLQQYRSSVKLTGSAAAGFMRWAEKNNTLPGLFSLNASELRAYWEDYKQTSEYTGTLRESQRDKLKAVPSYWDQFSSLLDWIAATYGVNLRFISLPHTCLSIPAYMVISRQEAASNFHRFDGLKYGRPADWLKEQFDRRYQAVAVRNRMQSFGKQPKLRVMMGIHVLQQKNAAVLSAARQARAHIRSDFQNAFSPGGVDFVLGPAVTTTAPPFGGFADTVTQQKMDEFTVLANLAGVPSAVVPFYTESDGMPQAVQVIAPDFHEKEMFELARAVEAWREYGGNV